MFTDLVRLKVTDKALDRSYEMRQQCDGLSSQERLIFLANSQGDDWINSKCNDDIDTILSFLANTDKGNDPELERYVVDKQTSNKNDFKTLVNLLVEHHGATVMSGYRKWFYSTGNIDAALEQRGIYLVTGTKSRPTTWKYEMSDQALIALVSLCFTPTGESAVSLFEPRILVTDLLERLKMRFGILVSEYPEGGDELATQKACSANLKGFLDRLRVLGCYEGLSDDLEAQFVAIPGVRAKRRS
jgi:hypothetical protein